MSFNLKLKIQDSRYRFSQGGYTFVELAFAVSIIGILTFTSVSLYKIFNRAYWQVLEKSRLQRTLIFTMDQMVRDLRQAVTITAIGPVTPRGTPAGQPLTIWGTPYPDNVTVQLLPLTTIHLDQPATAVAGGVGTIACRASIPNITNPAERKYDTKMTYFLRRMPAPDNSLKLYRQMTYYDQTRTESFPVLANSDQYRLGKGVSVSPVLEPTPGGPTPTPNAANTPVPSVFNSSMGQLPGVYNASDLNFDDVSFFYDNNNGLLAVGLTLSIKSKSLGWISGNNRRRLSLTSSVALRRTEQ